MGFLPGCCSFCGVFSLIGALFYACIATMVARRNQVFLEHKAGLNIETSTDEEFKALFWSVATTSIVSIFIPT